MSCCDKSGSKEKAEEKCQKVGKVSAGWWVESSTQHGWKVKTNNTLTQGVEVIFGNHGAF